MLTPETHLAYKLIWLQQRILRQTTQSSSPLDSVLRGILKAVCSTFKFQLGLVWLKSSEGKLNHLAHWANVSIEKSTALKNLISVDISSGQSLCGWTLKNKRTKVTYFDKIDQTANISFFIDPLGFKSSLTIPIFTDSHITGVIALYSTTSIEIADFIVEFNEILAAQIGQLIKRRKHSEQISQNEERYRALVELAPDIIYGIYENNIIESLNDTTDKITGYKKTTFINKSLGSLFVLKERKATLQLLNSYRAIKKPTVVITKLRNKYNKEIIAEIVESPVVYENDKGVRRFGIIRDITERFNLEKQKEIWVAMASHELRTPLTTIKAFAQIIQAKEKDHEKLRYLAKINNTADAMTNIIDDFLDATNIKSGKLKLEKMPFNLTSLINEIVDGFLTHTKHKISLALEKNVIITADKKRIRQVLSNLITNALKYSPEDKKIIIKCTRNDNYALISVTDFGIGIKRGDKRKIFDLFYRASEQTSTGGLGLGLFITRALVKAHGGTIFVESVEKKGSTFHVRLPA